MNIFFHKTQLLMVEINIPAQQQLSGVNEIKGIDKIEKAFYNISQRTIDRR